MRETIGHFTRSGERYDVFGVLDSDSITDDDEYIYGWATVQWRTEK